MGPACVSSTATYDIVPPPLSGARPEIENQQLYVTLSWRKCRGAMREKKDFNICSNHVASSAAIAVMLVLVRTPNGRKETTKRKHLLACQTRPSLFFGLSCCWNRRQKNQCMCMCPEPPHHFFRRALLKRMQNKTV